MMLVRPYLAQALLIAISAFTTVTALADSGRNSYVVTNLTSDSSGVAPHTDPVLQNPWGVAFSPDGGPFWIADNATGCSTLYGGHGAAVALQISIPLPGNVVPITSCRTVDPKNPPHNAAPTGVIWNPSPTFLVPGTSSQATFIFDAEDGTLSAWASGGLYSSNNAVIAVNNSKKGAVYKGLAFGVNVHGPFLFATNFNAGTIDVFGRNGSDGHFTPATTDGGFADPNLPAGYAPFGIQNIDGNFFVTYAKQDAAKKDDVPGPGNDYVDIFNTNGYLLRRFVSMGPLNSPWGVARASYAFGPFSGQILIGNFGNGKINVFDLNGQFIDALDGPDGKALRIDGLWTLTLGGGRNSSPDTLYFTAGPNDEMNGLFGTITPASAN